MAKVDKSPALKSRQTKLGKKSPEQLVEIIIRKDKTEHNLKSQIVNLKAEVNTLTSRVNNFNKDQEGNIKEIANLRDTVKSFRERIDSLRIKNNDLSDSNDKLNKNIVDLELNNHTLRKVTYGLTFLVVAAIAAIIIVC